MYYLTLLPSGPLPVFFIPAAVLSGLFILVETIADRQQEVFQTAKHSGGKADVPEQYEEDIPRGFLTHGLFSVSRHPNYFGELGFWWSVWLMALAAGSTVGFAGTFTGLVIQSGLFGPLALTALFIGSTIFTESISVEKYPAYKDYRKEVSPIIPWVPRKKTAAAMPQNRKAEN
ncbi:DUF1295 domain-containing protein [Brucepastera parasyntrophica]|uniref:DUF1295 domain-containing protein n=1 Tax=Brucepastera parasyntrophica TaxID=2880008 RepID=UPI00210CC54A|nr:DUF1295 domain-containing protein [Brucepastera parasyntrophica]